MTDPAHYLTLNWAGTRYDPTLPAVMTFYRPNPTVGSRLVVHWRAPDLNCGPLRIETTLFKDNGIVGRRLEAFILPADYAERTPAEVVNEAAR
ncbi:MAG: hypothetical protein IT162_00090 [Bryobacterales bacterium]|nr:hypothetical protein [Bryobacterales bacterium]